MKKKYILREKAIIDSGYLPNLLDVLESINETNTDFEVFFNASDNEFTVICENAPKNYPILSIIWDEKER